MLLNWSNEKIQILTKQMHLNFIEAELMNYYWHLAQWKKYEEEIRELQKNYQEGLDCPHVGGSLIRISDGGGLSSPWQIDLSGVISALKQQQELEEQYLIRVDNWMKVCTPAQEKMVRQYVMIQQCNDAAGAGRATGYSEDNVKKARKQVLEKIYQVKFLKTVHSVPENLCYSSSMD